MTRRDGLIVLVAALVTVAYVLMAAAAAGEPGFPLDDSWIHQTYARNLAQTGQWAFVPGEPSAGSTSPLYTVLLVGGYALNIPYMAWTTLIGAGALALCGLVGARVAELAFSDQRGIGLWTGLALVTTWHLAWAAASGMETMLFGALTLVVILMALREPRGDGVPLHRFGAGAGFGLACALLVAARPEGVMLAGLAGLAVLAADVRTNRGPRLAWALGAAAGGLAGFAPYALLNISLGGSILPNTFGAKQAENAPLLVRGFFANLASMLAPLTAGPQLVLVPGMIVAVGTFLRASPPDSLSTVTRGEGEPRGAAPTISPLPRAGEGSGVRAVPLLLLLWPLALIVLYTLRMPAPYQHGRYLMPALPALIVLGVGGTAWIARQRPRRALTRIAQRSLILTAALLFPVFLLTGGRIFAEDVWRINSDMLVAARWLQANVDPADVLAVHDIGAVGFFASAPDRPRPILDLAGLVSPEVIPRFRDPAGMSELMRARGVRYLMLLPPQWDDLWIGKGGSWGALYCPVFNAGGGMGGMTVYEFRERGCP